MGVEPLPQDGRPGRSQGSQPTVAPLSFPVLPASCQVSSRFYLRHSTDTTVPMGSDGKHMDNRFPLLPKVPQILKTRVREIFLGNFRGRFVFSLIQLKQQFENEGPICGFHPLMTHQPTRGDFLIGTVF